MSFWQKLMFWRRRKPRHPTRFVHYIRQASDCVRSKGGQYKDRRDSKWHLVRGRAINTRDGKDWVFQFRGRDALGVCAYGSTMEVHIGSDGTNYNRTTALHEAGHVGLMQAGDFGHDPKYRTCFRGWSDTGYRVPFSGEHIAVVDYADGESALVTLTHTEVAQLGQTGKWELPNVQVA